MTNPARHRHPGDSDTDTEHQSTDAAKEVYGAFDDPEDAIYNSDPAADEGPSLFEVGTGRPMPDSVQGQPYRDGIGPFSSPVIVIVALLVIFIVLLVVFA